MKLLTRRPVVLERLRRAKEDFIPLLCPNAETPDEMEGILTAATALADRTNRVCTVGIGVTASYPDHPQLERMALREGPVAGRLAAAAETWLRWLGNYADRPGIFDGVEVIPFLDHGWAAHEADLALMHAGWFQDAMGIIMYDASMLEFGDNLIRTAAFVAEAGQRVVVEACPDKVYERTQIEALSLRAVDLLSRPEAVERFVQSTGVDLIVPNLGTEHRASGRQVEYRGDLSRDIARRVGPIQALHGTSSVGDRLGRLGADGICKVNYYTAMARAGTLAVRSAWAQAGEADPAPIGAACGSFWHRTRRDAIAANVESMLARLMRAVPAAPASILSHQTRRPEK